MRGVDSGTDDDDDSEEGFEESVSGVSGAGQIL